MSTTFITLKMDEATKSMLATRLCTSNV